MSVKSQTFYTVVCDGCPAELSHTTDLYEGDEVASRETAYEYDWRQKGGSDYCPECSIKRDLYA